MAVTVALGVAGALLPVAPAEATFDDYYCCLDLNIQGSGDEDSLTITWNAPADVELTAPCIIAGDDVNVATGLVIEEYADCIAFYEDRGGTSVTIDNPGGYIDGADNGFYVQIVYDCKSSDWRSEYSCTTASYGCPGSACSVYSADGFVVPGRGGDEEDSDDAPEQSRPSVSLSEPKGGATWEGDDPNGGTLNYVISVTGMDEDNLGVNFEFIAGNPTPGITVDQAARNSDFYPNSSLYSGTLTFTPGGRKTQTIGVSIVGDDVAELDEVFALRISGNPDTMVIDGPDTVRGLILDDDRALSRGAVTAGVVYINGELADEYERIEDGDTVETSDGPAWITIGGDDLALVIDEGGKISLRGNLVKQIKGNALYRFLSKPSKAWSISGRNSKTKVTGTTLTVETGSSSDRISTYEGSVKATGSKGRAQMVKMGFRTTCAARGTCAKPKRFTEPDDPFWEEATCPVGVSCTTDDADVDFDLDIRSATAVFGVSEIVLTITTHDAWDASDGATRGFFFGFDTKDDGAEDYQVYVWFYPDADPYGGIWDWETSTQVGDDAVVEKIDSATVRVTLERGTMIENTSVWWYLFAGYEDAGCPATESGGSVTFECFDWAPDGDDWVEVVQLSALENLGGSRRLEGAKHRRLGRHAAAAGGSSR